MTIEELEDRIRVAVWCKNSAKVLSMHENHAQIELKNDDPRYPVRVSQEDLDALRSMGFDNFSFSVLFGVMTLELYWDQAKFDAIHNTNKRKSNKRKRTQANKKPASS